MIARRRADAYMRVMKLASVLTEHGVPNRLYVYPGGHLVPRSNPLMFERVREWYAAYGVK
jgi:hypothetical protein